MTTSTQPNAENRGQDPDPTPATSTSTPESSASRSTQSADAAETAQSGARGADGSTADAIADRAGHTEGDTEVGQATTTEQAPEVLYCANHPDRETLLRCNRCGKPICLKCATLTDVGYRCRECIRGVQDSYFNAGAADNLIAFVVSAAIAAAVTPIAGLVLRITGFFGIIVAFLIGGAAGGSLAQIVRMAVGRRRGRYLRYFALGGIVLGLLLGSIIGLFLGIPTLNLPLLLFAILAAIAAFQILR